jgi:quinoprotein glucose dehydrogenase
MFLTGGSGVFALEPDTGRQVWRFEAKGKVAHRGVAYWPGDGALQPRIFSGVADGRLVALDAKTGDPVIGFGDHGFVDLKAGVRGVDGPFMLDSPPVLYRNILITGGSNTEGEPSLGLYGDIRAWDAATGKLLWSFHTVPRAGEPGVETWEGESWKNRSGTNAWTYMTVDVERGVVFAATGSPTSDFYGADRKGRNLYGNSLIALDAQTGQLKWFQQLVHHDIWDWDLPAAPTLIEVTKNGRKIPAVAQMTKMSTLFIFNRINGEPLF